MYKVVSQIGVWDGKRAQLQQLASQQLYVDRGAGGRGEAFKYSPPPQTKGEQGVIGDLDIILQDLSDLKEA